MEFYSIEEVADMLKTSYNHIWRLIKRGDMRAAKIGGIWRVSSSEIERLAQGTNQKELQS